MKIIDKIIVRLDAGNSYGLGHLSRCISIVKEIISNEYIFVIKTDNENLVKNFIINNLDKDFKIKILSPNIDQSSEFEILFNIYRENSLLIIDHYDADEKYQKSLFDHDIKWLQLDSHAKVNFYATWVIHGSPGTTKEMYEKLRKNQNTKFLLGPRYCIIKEKLLKKDSARNCRSTLKKIIICFGGGDDRNATIQCLRSISFNNYLNVKFYVSISPYNKNYEEILEYEQKGNIEIIKQEELHLKMMESDLAIVAPGMISYECTYLGLPMLLVTIADNQFINSIAWEEFGCAINLGIVDDIPNSINQEINNLITIPSILKEMSTNCLNLVDGKGVLRIVNEITIN